MLRKPLPRFIFPTPEDSQSFVQGGATSSYALDSDYKHLFKILLLGDSGVGKSCLLLRYAENTYTDAYINTIGVDFKTETLNIEGTVVKTQVWDTTGQDKFRTIQSAYYRGAHAVIIAFDLTDLTSFHNTSQWLTEASKQANNENVNIILVGAKCDKKDQRVVGRSMIEAFVKDHPEINAYVETSAKTGENVEALFRVTGEYVLDRMVDKKKLEANRNKPKDPRIVAHEHLLKGLKDYIDKIEKYRDTTDPTKPDFGHNFWFFKQSRLANRKANYELARKLYAEASKLNPLAADYIQQVAQVFNDLDTKRGKLIKDNHIDVMPYYVNRGINSSDLNDVIKEAKALTRKKP